jgi:hypothetical protein
MRRTLLRILPASALLLGVAAVAGAQPKQPAGGSIRFTQTSFNVPEESGVAVITVRRHGGSAGEVSVDYATADGTATDGADYTGVAGTLVWGDGDGSTQSFEVPLIDDDEDEGLETVALLLSNVTGGAALDKSPTTATLKILPSDRVDDEEEGEGEETEELVIPPEGLIRFDQKTYQTPEDATVAVITVRRQGGATGEVSVSYATTDGSAVAPDDYETTLGELTWGDGEDGLRTFTVPIVDDDVAESTEKIGLLLSDPVGGALLHPDHDTASVILHDNERKGADDRAPGVIGFSSVEYQEIEGDTFAVITVERRYGKRGVVQVEYASADGSATDGLDYEAVSGTLVWARGDDRPKTFSVPILADDEEEGSESVLLSLLAVAGGADLDPERSEATLQILDDDSSLESCVEDADTACFQNGRFAASVVWRAADGRGNDGKAIEVSDQSALFYFFDSSNAEMLIKVVDACGVAGLEGYWFFVAATTDLGYTLTVTDTATGVSKQVSNLLGRPAEPVVDPLTFRSCAGSR